MPGSLFPEGVGWGEAVDSVLMERGDVEHVFVLPEGSWGCGRQVRWEPHIQFSSRWALENCKKSLLGDAGASLC